MKSVDDSSETANKSADPTPTTEERTAAFLESIAARLGSLDVRFDLIEKRLDVLDRHVHRTIGADTPVGDEKALTDPSTEPNDEPSTERLAALYALRCDGRVLLSTRDLEGIDLSDRETFTGIVLSEAEASDALERIADAFEEAAAHSAGWLRRRAKKDSGSKE